MRITIPRLDTIEGPFSFRYSQKESMGVSFIVIPGHGGGRDGPTIPDRPEQEAWMRAESGLRESWYLTWEVTDAQELARFLTRIDAPGAFEWR